MRDRPILMSRPMVRKILDGTKTQTRRVIRPFSNPLRCSMGSAGDRLWVREVWSQPNPMKLYALYAADCSDDELQVMRELRRECGPGSYVPWRPGIHMPRWASRISLEITETRRQRLQEITHDDAAREGIDGPGRLEHFMRFWDSLNDKRPDCAWADNPWVWAISFRRVQP